MGVQCFFCYLCHAITVKNATMRPQYTFIFICLWLLLPAFVCAQDSCRLDFPNLEQLPSQRVSQVIQDSEGFLWYATEGGGLCRDDGRQMRVFRSDAESPELLCSNDIACLAEAAGRYIIIGTFHGANLLDKRDYSIRRLEEVDDKRVDDIVVSSRDGHWWLTANKKVYEYAADGRHLRTYPGADKYIFRLRLDRQGRLWGLEWEGGQLLLKDGRFVRASAAWPDSLNLSRRMTDKQGRQLIADIFGNCYAWCDKRPEPFFDGRVLTRFLADSLRTARGLSARPTAVALDKENELWFSTGHDIRRMRQSQEEVVLDDTKDVSAMVFTPDGTLWLATIFGTLMNYRDGRLTTDDYASNEYGDAVIQLDVDGQGRLILVSERYVRLYDPERQTLRQQSREAEGIYSIELQETQPGCRWSQPGEDVVERMPQWIWWVAAVLLLLLCALVGYICFLRRQSKRFLEAMKQENGSQALPADSQPAKGQKTFRDEWIRTAIAHVEAHLNDDGYGVEQLASDMCMSRMTFYRKIQSATGQKPTEFMRTIRLRRAAELLRQGGMTITEVSYATGFSSVSYFSRCFRTMYGVPPTQLGKTMTADDCLPSETPNRDSEVR